MVKVKTINGLLIMARHKAVDENAPAFNVYDPDYNLVAKSLTKAQAINYCTECKDFCRPRKRAA